MHFFVNAKDLKRGNARDRRIEGTSVSFNRVGVKMSAGPSSEAYGGGSRAEKAGVRVAIVQALSGVESRCVVRES